MINGIISSGDDDIEESGIQRKIERCSTQRIEERNCVKMVYAAMQNARKGNIMFGRKWHNLTVEKTAQKCKLHPVNVYKSRKQFVVEGTERILKRKKRETPTVPGKVTGEVEAHIIATACS